jgi:NADP-dependent 3-hydroxy acid dehydrogenase YdfG
MQSAKGGDEARLGQSGPLTGRSALVTGGSSGIGRAIALSLAEAGAAVGIVGRDRHRLASTTQAIEASGGVALPIVADLTEPGQIERLAARLDREIVGLNILVHSAGTYHRGPISQANIRDLDDLYRANVRAPYELTQALLPILAQRTSDVIFINSTQGLSANRDTGQFAATQHSLKAVADSLRAELNSCGSRVTTLHVGRTATPRQERVFRAEGRRYSPTHLIQPQDLGDLVVAAVALPRRTQVVTMTVWPTDPSTSSS